MFALPQYGFFEQISTCVLVLIFCRYSLTIHIYCDKMGVKGRTGTICCPNSKNFIKGE